MSKEICAATCSDNFDFVMTNDGFLSVETTTSQSLVNMLKLDFTSNDDWALDSSLGVHWFSRDNDGLIQIRGGEAQIVSAIQRKLMSIEGVREIEKIEIQRGLNRKLFITVTIISDTGEKIILEKGVDKP